jgi:hypothetical protein
MLKRDVMRNTIRIAQKTILAAAVSSVLAPYRSQPLQAAIDAAVRAVGEVVA